MDEGRGGSTLESDEAKTRGKRRNKATAKNNTGTTPSNQTRPQAGGLSTKVLVIVTKVGEPRTEAAFAGGTKTLLDTSSWT